MSIMQYLMEALNSIHEYPVQDPPHYGDSDYKKRGGVLIYTTPKTFLSKVPALEIDPEVEDNVDDLINIIKSGRKIDPATIYIDDNGNIVNHDGRHRAIAAERLGFSDFPVIVLNINGKELPSDISYDSLHKQISKNKF